MNMMGPPLQLSTFRNSPKLQNTNRQGQSALQLPRVSQFEKQPSLCKKQMPESSQDLLFNAQHKMDQTVDVIRNIGNSRERILNSTTDLPIMNFQSQNKPQGRFKLENFHNFNKSQ